tara:strand:- start:22768 stop:23739 length:972 start_codon:yes stop_codon:yes gene_type:complete
MPAVTTAVVGVASVGAGLYTGAKTREANEDAADKAELSEKNRRERASKELEKATTRYNEIREERPGLTVQEFLEEQATARGGPGARKLVDEIRSLKQEDVAAAQAVADSASQGNVDTFGVILDQVSGGGAATALAQRNENALGTNEIDAFNRALELRSTAIPAGTVKQNADGRFIEGQRSDKQVFNLAFETQEAQRDKQFSKLNTILENDRSVADRQQEKARDFLAQQDTASILNSLSAAASDRRDTFQARDEDVQLQNIRQFQAAAFSDQTKQITPATDDSAGLVSGGFDLALKGIGLAAQNQGVQYNPNINTVQPTIVGGK